MSLVPEAFRSLMDELRAGRRSRRRTRHGQRGQVSYAQDGEDLVLESLFFGLNAHRHKTDGFYVDIGAHHPFRFSNTNRFYRSGWRGVNIDPLPGVKEIFDKYRPEDINIEMGVSEREDTLDYYMFNEPSLNTFDSDTARRLSSQGLEIVETRRLDTKPLGEILIGVVDEDRKIDLMTIDAEGFDFEILKSNDWGKFSPSVIMIEQPQLDFDKVYNTETYKFLAGLKYAPHCKTVHNVIYVHNSAT